MTLSKNNKEIELTLISSTQPSEPLLVKSLTKSDTNNFFEVNRSFYSCSN
jgi:hypothetical protein